jgi:tRNA-specific 2-thiouridylase
MARLLAAMSGGVDSSVAAALSVRDGHDVTGVTLKQWEFPDEETRLAKGCCTLDAVDDARRAADVIGIPHYTFDLRDDFRREVVEPFVQDYAAGRTPNPCIRCNERVRFGIFLERARRLGFEGIVTGHYARVVDGRLHRARDRDKDQSYVLYALGPEVLECVMWPLGDMDSKTEVRRLAAELGFRNWDRPDSVDVCFVGEGRTPGDVVAEHAPEAVREGPILSPEGREVGRHRGLPFYTVGQRRGLGVVRGLPPERRAVAVLDPDRNAIVLGERPHSLRIEAVRPRFPSGSAPPDGTRVGAVVRYRGAEVPARFSATPDGFRLDCDEPVDAPAPGQSVVLYMGDEVVGGGIIDRAG